MNRREAIESLMTTAATLANKSENLPVRFRQAGDLIRPDVSSTESKGKFVFLYDVDPRVISEEERNSLREVVTEALKQSLLTNREAFVGLIIEDARLNKNFFDRFK